MAGALDAQAEPPYQIADRPDMAINAALRAVGVHADGSADEFATVGLDRHRWTTEWLPISKRA